MGEKSEIRVKFEIGEIKFEAEGSADLVERERSVFNNILLPAAIDAIARTHSLRQETQLLSATEKPLALESPIDTDNTVASPVIDSAYEDFSKKSLVSFVKSKGADAHYDFILCAVYFNGKRNQASSFSSSTIKELYSEAKKPLPGNLSMSLSELVKKGLIMEDISAKGKTPKQYVLTSEGEEVVKKMFPKEGQEKKPATKQRKQHPKRKSAYEGLTCDELNLTNYLDIKTLKSFKEKMVLALYIVTNEGKGEWFSTADVICIMTDILGESATIKQVDGVFRREKRWFKAENIDGNNKLVHRKLLNEAKTYAQSLSIVTE